MARLEGAYEQVSQRLMNIDARIEGVDRKVDALRDALNTKVDALEATVDQRFGALDTKIDQNVRWTIGIVLTTWLTSMGASLYLHH